jgi:hypothetical protein
MNLSCDSLPLKLYPYLEYSIASAPVFVRSSYFVGIHSALTLRQAHPWRPDHIFTVTTPHTSTYFADSTRQCSALYDIVQQYTTVFSGIRQCSAAYDRVQQYTTVFSTIRQFSALYDSVQQYTTVFRSIRECSAVHDSVQQYTTVFSSIRQCSAVYDSVQHLPCSSTG